MRVWEVLPNLEKVCEGRDVIGLRTTKHFILFLECNSCIKTTTCKRELARGALKSELFILLT